MESAIQVAQAEMEEWILGKVAAGFHPKAMEILENPEATEAQLESLKTMLDPATTARLITMAGTLFAGNLWRGEVKESKFSSVMMRLGMQTTKGLIILSLFSDDQTRNRELKARCVGIATLARLLAKEDKLRNDLISKVETAGLFSDFGRVILRLYETEKKFRLPIGYVDDHHREIAAKLLDRLNLGEIKEIAFPAMYDFSSLSSYVFIAQTIVEKSFGQYGLLALRSVMPDDLSIIKTAGSEISNVFQAIGLSEFVEIHPVETPEQKRLREKTEKK